MEQTHRERDWSSGDCREQGPTKLWRWRSRRVAHQLGVAMCGAPPFWRLVHVSVEVG